MDTTTLQALVALGTFAILVAGGLIAYGVLKNKVNTLARENTELKRDTREVQKELANFREHTATTFVSHMHIGALEERMTRTEERLVGELRHMRETLVSALQDLARKPKE